MTKYDANAIDLLSDIEQIRQRPHMWVGDADQVGHYVIFKEIIDNALDEAVSGHADKITVVLDEDLKGVTVEDNGRGIPFDLHAKSGISALATVFAFSKSGAKYNKESYGISIGTHGVGSTCTNALSDTFEATSWRGKKSATVSFKKGLMVGKDAVISNESKNKHGTKVHFRPDYADIFKDVSGYTEVQIKDRLEQAAHLLKSVDILFAVGKAKPEKIQCLGIAGLVKNKTTAVNVLNVTEEIAWEGKKININIDLAFGWGTSDGTIDSLVNLSRTKDGGQHQVGFENALTGFLLERAKNKCSSKEILENLDCALHITHPGPQFNSQTKDKLNNKGLASQIEELIVPHLKSWARKNAQAVDAFLANAVQLYEQREALKDLKKAQKELKVTKRSSRGILPAKLFEADCKPHLRELYLVEGDSAAGSAVRGRDASYQEILPLKGKILNAFRASEAEMLTNTEVAAIIAAVGGGFGNKFDLANCRVSKIILLSDGDHDGFHISSLILSLFARYMPALLEKNMIYMVDSPLFKASLPNTKTRWFGYTMEDIKAKSGKQFAKCDVTRLKGHGEANYDEVAEYAMKPSSRKLIQLSCKDGDFAEIEKVMGDDVLSRKELLGVGQE